MTAVAYAEYLLREEQRETRHEYIRGAIRSVALSTPDHSALAPLVLTLIGSQLLPGHRAFTCNLRIRITAADVATYADGAMVAGRTSRAEDDQDAVTNPLLLVEVTGDETDEYDRNAKLDLYRTIESLQEVLLVSHREPRLTVHRRITNRPWTTIEARSRDSAKLESVSVTLNVDTVYSDSFEGPSETSGVLRT